MPGTTEPPKYVQIRRGRSRAIGSCLSCCFLFSPLLLLLVIIVVVILLLLASFLSSCSFLVELVCLDFLSTLIGLTEFENLPTSTSVRSPSRYISLYDPVSSGLTTPRLLQLPFFFFFFFYRSFLSFLHSFF
ncbi:uncharacterized protein GGS22DRAFT_165783, partial [Annulohypoxylon maeteangense]|uniref:uncharacterized protein n=1 Tax=Annulohypoxylon maeteangense TaxID=1927788 RepID=UPI002007BD93